MSQDTPLSRLQELCKPGVPDARPVAANCDDILDVFKAQETQFDTLRESGKTPDNAALADALHVWSVARYGTSANVCYPAAVRLRSALSVLAGKTTTPPPPTTGDKK